MGSTGKFYAVSAREGNKNYSAFTERENMLYERAGDVRSPFARDYTRILHSNAYRRLKHKTQVFFNAENDHVCTRMEHVAHVDSVAYTIAAYLGLNEELTRAIAIGHDLGHAPFGHHGERVLSELSMRYLGKPFWHEQNGLRMVDKLELLEDSGRVMRNLRLTYAMRDGIISHCGEVDENGLRPRGELFNLDTIEYAGQYQPATWEGCVVKLSDKIAYLGRDIEDALSLGIISPESLKEGAGIPNTTVIMRELIADVCTSSSPADGVCMSGQSFSRLNAIKRFNLENIYKSDRFRAFEEYSRLIIVTLFDGLCALWKEGDLSEVIRYGRSYPELGTSFCDWLAKYCDDSILPENLKRSDLANDKIYGTLSSKSDYIRAVLDFISGMTDPFAVKLFGEQLRF